MCEKMKKYACRFVLALCLTLFATACGKGKGEQPDQGNAPSVVLTPTETDGSPKWQYSAKPLELETDQNLYHNAKQAGEYLYYYVREDGAESSCAMYRYSVADGGTERLPMTVEGAYNIYFDIGEDGCLYVVAYRQEKTGDIERKELEKYDASGKLVYSTDITEQTGESWFATPAVDGEGRVYLLCGDMICLFDGQGSYAGGIDPVDVGAGGVSAMCRGKDGKVYACVRGHNNSASLAELDFAGRKADVVMQDFATCVSDGISVGQEKDLLVNDGSVVYGYDLKAKAREALFAWTDSGIIGSQVKAFGELSDGRILAVLAGSSEKGGSVMLLSRRTQEEMLEKEELVLGTVLSSDNLEEIVANFNSASDRYHVTLKKYLEGQWSTEALEEAETRMNLEIVSGNGPDLIVMDLTNSEELENLAEQGILEDLMPYLEKSAAVSREDFVDNTLEACVCNGALVCIPKQFTLSAMIGNAAVVGEKRGLDLKAFMALVEEHPQSQVLGWADKNYLLRICLQYGMDAFVDHEAGTCSFDSTEFIRLLEFADRHGAVESKGDDHYEEKLRRGDILFSTSVFQKFESIQKTNDTFEGHACLVGYPTADGSLVSELRIYAMCSVAAYSEHKEGAWAFLESYVTAENGRDMYSFPTLKTRLEEQLRDLQLERLKEVNAWMLSDESNPWVTYEKDSEGNVVRDEDGKLVVKGITLYDDGDFAYHNVTQEEAEQMMEIIRTARPQSPSNAKIWEIVSEEAEYFFESAKPAKDVADVIQSRVRLYLSENQ